MIRTPGFPALCLVALLLLGGVGASASAQEPAGFRPLLAARQRETLKAVSDYVVAHPEADDVEEARNWLFEAAVAGSLEAEAIPAARACLEKDNLDPALRTLALQVVCIGSARQGDLAAAQGAFPAFLRGFRIQSPFKALDVANILAARAQLAGDRQGVREVYDAFSSAFALNSQATEIVENRLARVELLGKPAPAIQATDLEGQPVSLADYAGKVVLVDFWATNCAPCLAEFPNLKRLYRQHQGAGFEILGVSFDDSPQTVATFCKQQKLGWRQVVNPAGQGGVAGRFQTRTIPALFVIDRKGQVAFVDVRGEELREAIEKLVKETP